MPQIDELDSLDTAIDDDELTAQALAADPDAPLPDGAVSLWDTGVLQFPLLPGWYMPAPMSGRRRLAPWQRKIVWLVVAAFLVVDAYGLCSTYGWVVPG